MEQWVDSKLTMQVIYFKMGKLNFLRSFTFSSLDRMFQIINKELHTDTHKKKKRFYGENAKIRITLYLKIFIYTF